MARYNLVFGLRAEPGSHSCGSPGGICRELLAGACLFIGHYAMFMSG
jgi:hypothetical protein